MDLKGTNLSCKTFETGTPPVSPLRQEPLLSDLKETNLSCKTFETGTPPVGLALTPVVVTKVCGQREARLIDLRSTEGPARALHDAAVVLAALEVEGQHTGRPRHRLHQLLLVPRT